MLPDDPDSQARLFYLVLLGMAVAVWAFSHYRNRLGQAMQHAAIWGLIFIGVVLAIGFFEPLKQQLFHDEAQRIDAETIALRRAEDGHFYATMTVNGEDIRAMIDTGATNLVLSKRDAERIGIDTQDLSFLVPTETANGRIMSAPVRLETVKLADFTDRDVRATVNGGDLDQSLIGMAYLDRYSGFQVEGDVFYLRR